MPLMVKRFRLTLLWVWTDESLLPVPAPASPGYWVSDRKQYVAQFAALRDGGVPPHAVGLPWDKQRRQRFWSFYADGTHIADDRHQKNIGPAQGFKQSVPFRIGVRGDGIVGPTDAQVRLDGFLLPVGVGLAVTIDGRGDWSLDDATARMVAHGTDALYTPPGAAAPVRAADLRRGVESRLHGDLAVPKPVNPLGDGPLGIATVIAAEDGVAVPVVEGDATHRALYGMASLSPTWTTNPLPSLASNRLPPATDRPASHLTFATASGRAVWHPEWFLDSDDGERGRLHCYHRNAVFSALQVQALSQFLRLIQKRRADGEAIVGSTESLAKDVIATLSALYGGAASTYRSWSARRWVDDRATMKSLLNQERVLRSLAPIP
jgi:hypothetical protein